MTKTELAKLVAEKAELSQKKANEAVSAVFDVIQGAVAEGNDVVIPGFGSFSTKTVAAKEGEFRGVKYSTKAHKSPSFRAGAAFKKAVE